jgi:hypothetical protein
MLELGIEPGTTWLVVRNGWPLDHEAENNYQSINMWTGQSDERNLGMPI